MDQNDSNINESLIRLEAKIDVVLSRHEGKIDDLTRRQGETSSTLREHDARITANALTIAETRSVAASLDRDVKGLEADLSKKGMNFPAWAAVAVAALAVVLDPILTALIHG